MQKKLSGNVGDPVENRDLAYSDTFKKLRDSKVDLLVLMISP